MPSQMFPGTTMGPRFFRSASPFELGTTVSRSSSTASSTLIHGDDGGKEGVGALDSYYKYGQDSDNRRSGDEESIGKRWVIE